MPRTIIATPHAPAAIGPYSQAVSTGALIYTSGQLGLDPATGQLAQGVEAQARQVMANLAAVLAAAGSSLDQVVKTTIFLQNMADFAACERHLWRGLQRRAAGALHRAGGRPAVGRPGGNRGRRAGRRIGAARPRHRAAAFAGARFVNGESKSVAARGETQRLADHVLHLVILRLGEGSRLARPRPFAEPQGDSGHEDLCRILSLTRGGGFKFLCNGVPSLHIADLFV
jgi:reactive intermediate/imine deaminase